MSKLLKVFAVSGLLMLAFAGHQPQALAASGVPNTITITEKSGSNQTNYPVQIGRPFVQGEIPSGQSPQAFLGSAALNTQVDVKNRWSDGSLKFALVSFILPSLPANGSETITFLPGSTVGNTPLTTAQMLDPSYNFDAQMLLTNKATLTADARTMLGNGDYTLWTSGPLTQTVLIADDTNTQTCNGHACSKYDIGFDANKSFRPRFYVTFWPSSRNVQVRFVGEIANTETLQNQTYSLALNLGQTNPTQVYTKPSFTQLAATRWTEEYWIGPTPSDIQIDYNLPYLIATGYSPNFDLSKIPSASAIADDYAAWTSANTDINGLGTLTCAMSGAGDKPEVGIFSDWSILWLYSMDNRMKDVAFGNADLAAGQFAWHLREGKPGKDINRGDPPGAGTGVGKILAVTNRPTYFGLDWTHQGTAASDAIVPVGDITGINHCSVDTSHAPDLWMPLYFTTGDYWYLEESQFFSSYVASYTDGIFTKNDAGRGPTGAEGAADDEESRAEAWTFSGRAQTAAISPDGSPEQAYFTNLLRDAIATEEGAHGIPNSQPQDAEWSTMWNWGKTYRYPVYGGSPLHAWYTGNSGLVDSATLNASTCSDADSPWMESYLMLALGRVKELGYPDESLVSWYAPFFVGTLTDSGYNPYLIAMYRDCTKTSAGWLTSWAAKKAQFVTNGSGGTNYTTITSWPNLSGTDSWYYARIATAAVSMMASEPGGSQAWNFMNAASLSVPQGDGALGLDPKWDIMPRSINNSAPAPLPPPAGQPVASSTPPANPPAYPSAPASGHTVYPRVGELVYKQDKTVYLVGSNGLYGFPNAAVFYSWGYKFSDVIAANSAEQALSMIGVIPAKASGCKTPLDQVAGTCGSSPSPSAAPRIGQLVYNPGSQTVYLVGATGLYGFPNAAVFYAWDFSLAEILPENSVEQDLAMVGLVPSPAPGCNNPLSQISGSCDSASPSPTSTSNVGQLVYNPTTGNVYLVGPHGLYGFASITVFNSWGFTVSQIVPENSAEAALSQIGIVPAKLAACKTPLDQIIGTCGNP